MIYREEQDASRLPADIQKKFYSIETSEHVSYYGEIISAYMIED